MAEFTKKELQKLGIFPPKHAYSLCKQAIKLSLSTVRSISNEEVLEFMSMNEKIIQMDTTGINPSKIATMAEHIQPLSNIFEDQGRIDTFEESYLSAIPIDLVDMTEGLEDFDRNDIKMFMAASILALIIDFNAKEKVLISGRFSESDKIKAFDTLSNNIRISYEMLLYFDSEVETIKNKRSRQKGVEKRNAKYKEIHQAYILYYDASRQRIPSDAECARRFYNSLPDEKKVYRTEIHAVRQLTEKHRKYRKSNTST